MEKILNSYGVRQEITIAKQKYIIYCLKLLQKQGIGDIERLPFSLRILIESLCRNEDGREITHDDIFNLIHWNAHEQKKIEIPFKPARVVLQDFTGVPAVVDLAALRSAAMRLGADPQKINPRIPVDLVIDHSVQVDHFGSVAACEYNTKLEFERNRERYEFLKWAAHTFKNFRVVPPATGIVHQVNLEFLATVVCQQTMDSGETILFPDTVIGTDSHTPMINGIGVVGWGVGGIEAEATMLGQPYYMLAPEVIGFKLSGRLQEGVTATDLVLTITQMLRQKGVVGKFIEFYGPAVKNLSVADRATIANMSPESGATISYFPVDEETLNYLHRTGRSEELITLVEHYYKEQGLFNAHPENEPEFSDSIELDLSDVVPSIAGPKRPQDRISLGDVKNAWQNALITSPDKRGFGKAPCEVGKQTIVAHQGETYVLKHGAVVIAAITSCTNTSNPGVMIAAGMLARKAVEKGLKVKPWVKTSLAPGSTVVTRYLQESSLLAYLQALGFHVVGYGCTTCIGNSGSLSPRLSKAIKENNLVVAAALSGNRNFEGRINPDVQASYLMSPPLVVAYAIAGTIDIDLTREPIGIDPNDQPVYLSDIWPGSEDIQEMIHRVLPSSMFREQYADVYTGSEPWNMIPIPEGEAYEWHPESSYIQQPPFFKEISAVVPPLHDIRNARVFAWLPDSTTTDHISPAGSISPDSPAGKYLIQHGVRPVDFNSYGSRRGNHEVMMRGTLANIRIKNKLLPGVEGGYTVYQVTGERLAMWDAALKYMKDKTPLIILAGKEYGTGSSRDWAAKGVLLQGVTAVIAESYERIHRSNLVGMGVLPLQFQSGERVDNLGLSGFESYDIVGIQDNLKPGATIIVRATNQSGKVIQFSTICRIDSQIEVDYFKNGGILHTVLRKQLFSS